MSLLTDFPWKFARTQALLVVLSLIVGGLIGLSAHAQSDGKAKATPTPTPDPLAFTAAEQGEARLLLAEQEQIGKRIRQLHTELLSVREDDNAGFALVGLKLQKQIEKQTASEQQGAKFIEKVKPRCPDCIFDFNNMRLIKPNGADTASITR